MFTVTAVNLSSDTTRADPTFGPVELGVLTPAEFTALLARFAHLDSVQNHEADPHLLVTAAAGRFQIRTGQGRLLVYNARDTTEPYSELTAAEIVAQLDRPLTTPPFKFSASAPAAPAAPQAAPHSAIAFAILVAGLALNAYTLYSVFYTESVHTPPAVILLTEPAELAARSREVVGHYATGTQPGDRVITVTADGKVSFFELGARDGFTNGTDTYRLGRHDKKLCLLTTENGVIDIQNPDTLVYYRDTYRRTR